MRLKSHRTRHDLFGSWHQVLAVPLRRSRDALNLPPAPDEVPLAPPAVRKEIQDGRGALQRLRLDSHGFNKHTFFWSIYTSMTVYHHFTSMNYFLNKTYIIWVYRIIWWNLWMDSVRFLKSPSMVNQELSYRASLPLSPWPPWGLGRWDMYRKFHKDRTVKS